MEVDIHHAETIKVRVRNFPEHTQPFCILDLKTESGSDISLFFDSLEEIETFARGIARVVRVAQVRTAKASP